MKEDLIKEIRDLGLLDLRKLKAEIEEQIKQKQPKKLTMKLEYNMFKGSGKCWVAEVDRDTKKILSFITAESVQKEGNHKGLKTYLLGDGYYVSVSEGTKAHDDTEYFEVMDGKIKE